jgi:hypothetical protein
MEALGRKKRSFRKSLTSNGTAGREGRKELLHP